LLTFVQRYVSTKLAVSDAFLFLRKSGARDERTDEQTDGRDATEKTLNAVPREGRLIMIIKILRSVT